MHVRVDDVEMRGKRGTPLSFRNTRVLTATAEGAEGGRTTKAAGATRARAGRRNPEDGSTLSPKFFGGRRLAGTMGGLDRKSADVL